MILIVIQIITMQNPDEDKWRLYFNPSFLFSALPVKSCQKYKIIMKIVAFQWPQLAQSLNVEDSMYKQYFADSLVSLSNVC